MKRWAWVVAALVLPGCYSFSTLGRARVVEAHHVEIFGAPAMLAVPSNNGAFIRPIGDLGLRYGLTDQIELDGRLTTLGLSAGTRLQLRRAKAGSGGLDVLIAPALAYTSPQKLAVELPLVLGWNVRGGDQVVFAPRAVYQARLEPRASFLFVGASIGYAWKVTPRWTLLPEVALLTQAYADPGYSSNVAGTVGIQASVGVLFDL